MLENKCLSDHQTVSEIPHSFPSLQPLLELPESGNLSSMLPFQLFIFHTALGETVQKCVQLSPFVLFIVCHVSYDSRLFILPLNEAVVNSDKVLLLDLFR